MIELSQAPLPEGALGVEHLGSPAVILLLPGLWAVIFLFSGRSEVITSDISIHGLHEPV
ncbi:MAG: hypothetical protein JSS27_20645 [Planctomycetes bacterium]|nr:hypothetical protein [Planctomycetota bacterium]